MGLAARADLFLRSGLEITGAVSIVRIAILAETPRLTEPVSKLPITATDQSVLQERRGQRRLLGQGMRHEFECVAYCGTICGAA